MKPADLIRHISSGILGIVLRSRISKGTINESVYNYIDFVWLDDGLEDSAFAGLFEVVSEVR